jgi:hypothetical protein
VTDPCICSTLRICEQRVRDNAIVEFMSNHDWMYKQGVQDCIDAIDKTKLEPETVGGLLVASAILRELLTEAPYEA